MSELLPILDEDVKPNHTWHANESTGRGVWHGKIRNTADPTSLRLYWRDNSKRPEQYIGTFRLHLNALLARRYIRKDGPVHVRVNFINIDGTIVLATSRMTPHIVIGQRELCKKANRKE